MTVVRVVVTRTGGFAGLTRTASVDDPERAGAIAAVLPAQDAGCADGRTRDGFLYAVTVVSRTTERTIELTAAQLPDALRGVVRDLEAPPRA